MARALKFSIGKPSESAGNRKFVPDTSVIISGDIVRMIQEGTIKAGDILLIPEFVVSELEGQANRGREIGFEGLAHLKEIRKLTAERGIKFESLGRKPTLEEIQLASGGRIDALIRDIAKTQSGILITGDLVQAAVAEAEGLEVIYFEKVPVTKIKIEDFFDATTMSVHLKEGTTPKAKKGKPGRWKLVELSDKVLTRDELELIAREIMDQARVTEGALVEIDKHGATVVQYKQYRIAITRPKFSEKMEITVVRPIVKVSLEDYRLSDKLKARLQESAEGIIVAGPPGSGKTTLAQAIAFFYLHQGKIVKTLEHPRDLQVSPHITQYGPLEGDMVKSADILLLVRPDFTVYDELRKTRDFEIFADLRSAGIGMLGVVHASKAVDAVQRFLGRVELGLIPQVIDTIIFVDAGKIAAVYSIDLEVRVPHGMTEADLARPVVNVRDFETGALKYEIYTYGEQTVVVPIKPESALRGVEKLAEERVRQVIEKFVRGRAEVKVTSPNSVTLRVEERDIPFVIGKQGRQIEEIEKRLGIRINVEPIVDTIKKELAYSLEELGGNIIIRGDTRMVGKSVDVYKGEEFLFSATVGKDGRIRVKKKSELGRRVLQAAALKNLRVLV